MKHRSGKRRTRRITLPHEDRVQEKTERWKELCEQAAVEQDPQRLLELTREINDLLLGKQRRLERPDDKELQGT
jgi:hypothetical protein